MKTKILLFIAVLFFPYAAQFKLDKEEHWYEYLFQGAKVGYMVTQEKKIEKGGKTYLKTESRSYLKLKRFGQEVSTEGETFTLSKENLMPVEFVYVSKQRAGGEAEMEKIKELAKKGLVPAELLEQYKRQAAREEKIEGKVKEGVLKVNHTVGGITQKRTKKLPPTVFFSSALGIYLRDRLKSGFSGTYDVIVEELGTVAKARVTVEGISKVTHRGKQQEVMVLRGEFAGIVFREWIDDRGVSIYTELPTMGMVAREVSKAKALKFEEVADLFLSTLINVPKDLPHPSSIKWMDVKLVFKNRDAMDIPQLESQKVVEKGRGFVKLHINKTDPFREMDTSLKIPISEKTLGEFLKPTPYEQSNNPELKNTAKKVVGAEKNPVRAAEKLMNFVYTHIKEKDLSKSYLSAVEVLETRQGDCTEHSVLMSALSKAVGIPARLVNGLVYSGGAFGYHEWVEIWAGKWIPFDPTFNEAFVNATHIVLARGSSSPEGILSFGKAAAFAIQNIELEIIRYETELDDTRR